MAPTIGLVKKRGEDRQKGVVSLQSTLRNSATSMSLRKRNKSLPFQEKEMLSSRMTSSQKKEWKPFPVRAPGIDRTNSGMIEDPGEHSLRKQRSGKKKEVQGIVERLHNDAKVKLRKKQIYEDYR